MDALTLFGLIAVTAMLVFYALEDRSPWFNPRLCRRLRACLALRLPARRLAFRRGGGDLGGGRRLALAGEDARLKTALR
jgi:hypothetical protein